jgi:dTDP-glucose 4,6-dehydratase
VEDHCSAVDLVLQRGEPGRVYNIGGCNEMRNIELVSMLVDRLGKPRELITHVADRPGHDRRYAIDAGRIMAELGWAPTVTFAEGLDATVAWYLANRNWWEKIRSGEYREYYARMYGARDDGRGGGGTSP